MGPHEQLRYLVGGKGIDYVIYWSLSDDQRSVDLTGCCCGGATAQLLPETDFISPATYLEGPKCPDNAVQHVKIKVCEFLMQMPLSISLDSGIHGQVLFTGQPRWVNLMNSDTCSLKEVSQAKVYVPMPTGLIELGLSNQAIENPSLIQLVMDKCGDIWLGSNANPLAESERVAFQGQQFHSGSNKGSFEMNGFFGGVNMSSMVVSMPESPLTSGFGKDFQNFQGLLEDKSMKKYHTNAGICGGTGDPKGYRYDVNSSGNNQLPWTPSTDLGSWSHEAQLHENHLSIQMGSQQLNFSGQSSQAPSLSIQKQRHDLFEGIGDSIHPERAMLPADQNFPDIIIPVAPNYPHQKSTFIDSPHASGLSKEVSDRDVKQEMRADSSDCSDQMEDDEEKGVARSGRRHLSKNLVAERKRRKKLNERLYSLRALVPKITKMDRASILGDAIEYVKELQQQVKELQEELLETREEDMQQNRASSLQQEDGSGGHQIEENGNIVRVDEVQCSLKADQIKISCDMNDRRIDDLNQPMQVEVSKMDGHIFSLRIFCEKRPGVFVKLMQALDVLGLDVLHANITTFRGLVLNVFNAEMRDKELLQAEQVKESLMEMTSLCESRTNCILGDLPLDKDLLAPVNI